MSTDGILEYQGTKRVLFRGDTSNIVFDTRTTSLGIGVTGSNNPSSNLYITGNAYVSSNLEIGGVMTMGVVNVAARHNLQAVTATGNVTTQTVQFDNPTTAFTTTGNVEIKNINMLHTANTASIKLNSNVVTEFPRSKKLIKYPRVAMTADAQTNSGYQGHFVSRSTQFGSYNAWEAFDNDNPHDPSGGAQAGWASAGPSTETDTYNWSTGAVTSQAATHHTGAAQGEWIQIQLPNAIYLHDIKIHSRAETNYTDNMTGFPKNVCLYGKKSNDWVLVKEFTTNSRTLGDAYTEYIDYTKEAFTHFVLVVKSIHVSTSSISGHPGWTSIGQIELFGVPEYDPEAHGTDVVVKSVANVPNTDWLEVYYDAKGLTPGAVTSVSDLKPSSLGTALNSSSTNNITVTDDAFVFNGTDSYIKIDDLTNPSGAWVHSVVAWINPSDLGGNFEVTWIGDVDSATTRQAFTFTTSGQAVTMGINGSNVQFGFVSPLTKNKWHHVVYTFNGGAAGSDSTAYRVFVDGVEAYKTTGVGSGTLTLPAQTALWIGRNHGGSNYFNGKIANLRLFNRALTTDEIYKLYTYQKEEFGHSTNNLTLKAGRLGIGTSEPRAALDVRGDMYGGCPVFWFASSSSTSGFLWYNQIHVNKGGGLQGDKFIAPISGYYHMTLHNTGNTGTSRTHRLEWFLNGVEIGYDGIFGLYATTGTNAHYQNIAGSLIWYMNAGAYMQVQVHNSSMNGNLNGWSGFFLST